MTGSKNYPRSPYCRVSTTKEGLVDSRLDSTERGQASKEWMDLCPENIRETVGRSREREQGYSSSELRILTFQDECSFLYLVPIRPPFPLGQGTTSVLLYGDVLVGFFLLLLRSWCRVTSTVKGWEGKVKSSLVNKPLFLIFKSIIGLFVDSLSDTFFLCKVSSWPLVTMSTGMGNFGLTASRGCSVETYSGRLVPGPSGWGGLSSDTCVVTCSD